MSFLKQLLNPFIEFDEEGKKREPQPTRQAPATPAPAPPPAAAKSATTAPVQEPQPTEHPLITGTAAATPTVAAAQVPTYNPSSSNSINGLSNCFKKLMAIN